MKNYKQIIKSFFFLLIFIIGSGSNVLFAKAPDFLNHSAKFSALEKSVETNPFLFQPLEDSENEEDETEDLFIETNSPFKGRFRVFCFENYVSSYQELSISDCPIWQLNCNFRL